MFWLFYNLHGAHFPAVELDRAIRFSTRSRMSGFLWRSSKWVRRFVRFLQHHVRLVCDIYCAHAYLCRLRFYTILLPKAEAKAIAHTYQGKRYF